ncbi:putative Ubiquitin-like domain superfamily, UBL3-like, ubiquitin domain-containing protein [Helianthus debilis subsp. tardiflorus]
MAADELIEVKFRLADGTDIGPSKYSSITTVGSLKEKIISQWPKVLPCHAYSCEKKN